MQKPNALVHWHLLSLDAPTVAALWTWFCAAANHIYLPAASVVAMAIAVWILYAADRLLDTRTTSVPNHLEERHLFHRSHSKRFAIAMIVASSVLALLLPMLPQSSIRLYGILGGVLFAYFLIIHLSGGYRLPKELAVGFFFSAATFIPTISRQPGLRLTLFPEAILFAVLCSLNCLFIYTWEHPRGPALAHPVTRFALRFLGPIATMTIFCAFALLWTHRLPWQISAACALSAGLLLLLHSKRDRFGRTVLRASADLCLLTPLLFLSSLR